MAFDGNGNWVSNFNAEEDRDNNIKILASRFDGIFIADIQQSFENCLTKDMQIKPQGNFDANSNRIINVADPVNNNDAVNLTTLNSKDGLLVHKSGAESITGSKTFSGEQYFSSSGCLMLKNTTVTKGTNPSSVQYWNIGMIGNTYNDYTSRLGCIESNINTSGKVETKIIAYKNQSSSTDAAYFGVSNSGGTHGATASSGVIDSITGWSVPKYTSGVSRSLNTTYTATDNGILYVYGYRGSGSTSTFNITINNVQVASVAMNDYNAYGNSFYLSKGDTYKTNNPSGTYKLTFFPLKG